MGRASSTLMGCAPISPLGAPAATAGQEPRVGGFLARLPPTQGLALSYCAVSHNHSRLPLHISVLTP